MAIAVHEAYALSAGGSHRTVDKPAGTAEGDVLIAFECTGNGPIYSPPDAGWTVIESLDGGIPGARAWYKIAGAGEPSSYTFTTPNTNTDTTISVHRISGADTDNPIDASVAFSPGSAANSTVPAVTTTGPDRLILAFWADLTVSPAAAPSGWTPVFLGSPQGNRQAAVAYIEQATQGESDGSSWTHASTDYVAITIAIAPGAGEGVYDNLFTQSGAAAGSFTGVLTAMPAVGFAAEAGAGAAAGVAFGATVAAAAETAVAFVAAATLGATVAFAAAGDSAFTSEHLAGSGDVYGNAAHHAAQADAGFASALIVFAWDAVSGTALTWTDLQGGEGAWTTLPGGTGDWTEK